MDLEKMCLVVMQGLTDVNTVECVAGYELQPIFQNIRDAV